MTNRITRLIPQLVCVAITFFALYPTWNQTTLGQKVFSAASKQGQRAA